MLYYPQEVNSESPCVLWGKGKLFPEGRGKEKDDADKTMSILHSESLGTAVGRVAGKLVLKICVLRAPEAGRPRFSFGQGGRLKPPHTLESVHAQSRPTPFDPVDCSQPGSSVHGIFQARILEWIVISNSKES